MEPYPKKKAGGLATWSPLQGAFTQEARRALDLQQDLDPLFRLEFGRIEREW